MRGVALKRGRMVQREQDRREPSLPEQDDDPAEDAEGERELERRARRSGDPASHESRDEARRDQREQPEPQAGDEAGRTVEEILRERPLVAEDRAPDGILGDEQS